MVTLAPFAMVLDLGFFIYAEGSQLQALFLLEHFCKHFSSSTKLQILSQYPGGNSNGTSKDGLCLGLSTHFLFIKVSIYHY